MSSFSLFSFSFHWIIGYSVLLYSKIKSWVIFPLIIAPINELTRSVTNHILLSTFSNLNNLPYRYFIFSLLRTSINALPPAPYPNVFAIPAYLAAYNNPEVVIWKTAMLNYVVKNYRYVREKLGLIPGLKVMELEASYLMWINYAETNLTSQQANELLLKYKLIVSKHNDFVEAPATCFRINIGTFFAMVVKLVNILITIFSK